MEQVKTEPPDASYSWGGWLVPSHSSVSVSPPIFTVESQELAGEPEVKPQCGERSDTESSAQDAEERSKALSKSRGGMPLLSAALFTTAVQAPVTQSVFPTSTPDLSSTAVSRRIEDQQGCFVCDVCSARYMTEAFLNKHKKSHEKSPGDAFENCFVCDTCSARYISKADLEKHKLTHAFGSCKICNASFKHRSSLNKHIRSVHTHGKIHGCDVCERKFVTTGKLKQHMMIHSGEKPFLCDQCPAGFTARTDLRKHYRCHIGQPADHACHFCNASFGTPLSLIRHENTWHKPDKGTNNEEANCGDGEENEDGDSSGRDDGDPPTFTCNVCGYRFDTKAKLKKHKVRHTLARPFSCEHCDSKFTTKGGLTKHVRRHTGERPYACGFCDARFTQSSGLKIHERSAHTGERPYVCGECQSGFASQAQLITHQRLHTGLKPYACKECPKKFRLMNQLKQHSVKHTGEKKYRCTLCDAAFTQAHSLRAHERGAHTGERPYECKFCSATFIRSGSLYVHVRKHTDTPYACKVLECSAAFGHYSDLKEHIKTHARWGELGSAL